MAIDLAARFDAGQAIIREAAGLALKHYRARDTLEIDVKGKQDFVSIADKEVEQLIRARIEAAFPGDTVMGEEEGVAGEISDDGLWVVDPIDGTAPFLAGMPTWCISVAYVRGKDVPIGLLHAPVMDELYASLSGHGATMNGKPMQPHKGTSLDSGLFGVGYSLRVEPEAMHRVMRPLLAAGGVQHCNSSGALMTAYVASGGLIGYYEPHINAWDCAAGIGLVREAGGWTNDFFAGDGLNSGGPLLAAAPGVAAAAREISGL